MNEQQRTFLAIGLCLVIIVGWSFITNEMAPAPKSARPLATGSAAGAKEPVSAARAGAGQSGGIVAAEKHSEAAVGGSGNTVDATGNVPEIAIVESRQDFTTPLLRGEMSSVGLGLTRLELRDYDEHKDVAGGPNEEAKHVSLVAPGEDDAQGRLQIAIDGTPLPYFQLSRSDGGFLAKATLGSVRIDVQVLLSQEAYALTYVLNIHNEGVAPVTTNTEMLLTLTWVDGKRSFFAPPAERLSALCGTAEGVERRLANEVKDEDQPSMSATWAGIDRQYFVAAVVAGDEESGSCSAQAANHKLQVTYGLGAQTLEAGASLQQKLILFVGPKRDQDLTQVDAQLADAIEYNIWGIPLGALARPMVFLLNLFHRLTASWGLAIMLLTLVVKLLLFPVTYKSVMSMRKMQLLKPELDRIRQQFAGDRERQQMEQLKLFRTKSVNPVGGCLPMLLQMPVWFALYRMLWTTVDLYQQPFLWIADLTAKEPFPVLALLLGGLTFVQQKITPAAVDNQQAKVMLYIMPVMLTVFMVALPSGLVLYVLVNSILTIVQQLAINRRQVAL